MSLSDAILKYVFPKTYTDYENYKDNYLQLVNDNNQLKSQMKSEIQIMENIKYILNDRNIILGVERINKKENVIIYRENYRPTIYVVASNNPKKIYCKLVAGYRDITVDIDLNIVEKTIHIENIYSYNYINQGYGSIAIEYLLELSNNENIRKITAWISQDNKDHIQRLYHFFYKYGFTIDRYNYVKKEIAVLI